MFKTQVEPRAAGERSHCKVWNILWRHFYSLYECGPWKIVVDLSFTITFIFFYDKLNTKNKQTNKQKRTLRDMLSHFHGRSILSQTIALDKPTREDSLSYCKIQSALQSSHVPVDSRYWFQVSGTWILDSNC